MSIDLIFVFNARWRQCRGGTIEWFEIGRDYPMKYQAKSLCFQRHKGMKGTEIYKTLGGLESVGCWEVILPGARI